MMEMDEDEMSSEAEDEVTKVMNEIIGDKFKSAGAVPTARPVRRVHVALPARDRH